MNAVECWYHYFLDRQAYNNFAAYLFLAHIGSILTPSLFQPGCYPPRNTQKTRLNQVERFITKKVIAMAVCEVLSSLAITRFRLNLLFRKSQIFPQLPDEFSHLLRLVSLFLCSHWLEVFLTEAH